MQSTDSPMGLMSQAGQETDDDDIIRWMKKNGIELTRENYLEIAYMGDEIPADLDEMDLPAQIRKT